MELIAELPESSAKRRVLEHLGRADAIVAVELSTGDEAGYEAAGTVIEFVAEQWGGLVQADGGGFYEGRQLILELK